MAKKTDTRSVNPAAAMKQVERDAYAAYKEWPVWLHLRLKEVEQHLTVVAAGASTAEASSKPRPPVVSRSISMEEKPVDKKKSVLSQLGKTLKLDGPNIAAENPTTDTVRHPPDEAAPAAAQLPLLPDASHEVTEAEVLDFLATFDSRGSD